MRDKGIAVKYTRGILKNMNYGGQILLFTNVHEQVSISNLLTTAMP
jgi:hypothetical protein